MKKIDVFIQARLTSSRLPNKVLTNILNNKNSLEIIYDRIKKNKNINKIVFLIPKNKKNILLKNFLVSKKYLFFEGSEKNVLNRYYQAAIYFKSNNILRITADCPFTSSKLIDQIVKIYFNRKLDYISNNNPPYLPDGFDLELFNFKSLEIAKKNAKSIYEKEHVTPYIKNSIKFEKFNINYKKNYSKFRVTLDTKEDLIEIKKIIEYDKNVFSYELPKLLKIITFIQKNKNFLKLRDWGSKNSTGQKLFQKAKKIIPGGTLFLSKNPDRYIKNYWPVYFNKAKKVNVWDLDNIKYLDMSSMGVGTNVLGYAINTIDNAVIREIKKSNLSTLNNPYEVELSEKLLDLHKWANMCLFTRTGGEAAAQAIRIARSYVNKPGVLICGYHGWHDWYISINLSDKKNLNSYLLKGVPTSGIPSELTGLSFPFKYNNFEDFKKKFSENKNKIGTVIMEVERNEKPKDNFLQKIKKFCKTHNLVLIFDECSSGFRENLGGVHLKYNVNPDIVIYGKTLGNGYAINAILGKTKIMSMKRNTFISSTFWTEKIGTIAAIETINIMKKNTNIFPEIIKRGRYIKENWKKIFEKNKLDYEIYGMDSMPKFNLKSINHNLFKTFLTKEMLKRKILASDYIYISYSHSSKDLKSYIAHFETILDIFIINYKNKSFVRELQKIIPISDFQRLN